MAHNQSIGRGEVRGRASGQSGHTDKRGETLADPNGLRGGEGSESLPGTKSPPAINEGRRGRTEPSDGGEAATNAMRERSFPASLQGVYPSQKGSGARDEQSQRSCRWPAEPGVGRVAHGIPRRVDRIKCLGNAIVPQVAQIILEGIRKIEWE